jgi:hypothetical protein
MNSKLLMLGAAGLSIALFAGCHDDHRGASAPPGPPPPTSQSLDTAQVLALAHQTSETSAPFSVNGGAVTLNDASETSAPIAVNAM